MSFIIFILSALVCFGWVFDIGILKTLIPDSVSMKLSTAIGFGISAFIMFFKSKHFQGRNGNTQLFLSTLSIALVFFMESILQSSLQGSEHVMDTMFTSHADGFMSTEPGRPSVGTLGLFIFYGIASVLCILFEPARKDLMISKTTGVITCILSGQAILGYGLNIPLMYFYVEGVSTAMAIHTAIMFFIIGLNDALLRCHKRSEV